MAQYTLRDIPQDVWDQAAARAQRERWSVPDVMRRLLDDYAAGRVTPSGSRPADPLVEKFGGEVGPVFDVLAATPGWDALSDRERGQRLRAALQDEDRHHARPSQFAPDFDFTLLAKRLGGR